MAEQRLEARLSETPLLDPIAAPSREAPASQVLTGGGEMGALMRAFDWRATPLGPVDAWPQSLATTVSTCLNSRFPILVWWGPELVMLYNDAYRPIIGSKHPSSLGAPGWTVFPEVWDIIGPMLRSVMEGGEATWSEDQLLLLDRKGFAEECYFTFSYSPIRDESGGVGGVFTAVTETTQRVIGERRIATLRAMAERTAAAHTPEEAARHAMEVIEAAEADIPFALLYLANGDARTARLVGAAHANELPDFPQAVDLDALDGREWPSRARVLPVASAGKDRGILVAGVSPRLALDDGYSGFLELVAGQVATSIANAEAYEAEIRRAEALAELDRAKTTFFSNVSHEFRTPLTLLLGPAEEALATADSPENRERLAIIHRNALRLQRLVNTLLEFSRIEAGRIDAVFEPTDVGAYTVELASAFRSAVERAGLTLAVDCPAGSDAYVDRDMWEKIVLNLLSNAFKYTFEGGIAVRVQRDESSIELAVTDTGVGIAASELPRIFDRFHRVPSARARSHEGTGIGLSLVQELVRLHGGQIAVQSEEGRGTTVTVRIPSGKAHLPAERVSAGRQRTGSAGAAPFVEEALRWLPDDPSAADRAFTTTGELPVMRAETSGARILLADDNADMRSYVSRLLASQGWVVEAVADGTSALSAIERERPSLVVADVMMPGTDGFALLAALRAAPDTVDIPVLLLSARAGEESRIEGLRAGADDYLVKPFSARELVARVGAHLSLANARARAASQIAAVHAELEDAHARVRAEQSRLAWVLRQAPAFMCVVRGPDHVFELANDAYVRLVGREVIGKPVREALPEFASQGFFELLDGVVETGQPFVGREVPVLVEKNGESVEAFVTFVYEPIVEPDGSRTGVFVLGIDVTDEVLARREVDRARSDAETANRAKTEFLAAMSHELRTPLNAIAGYAQLLELGVHGALNEQQLDATRRIQRSEQHLLSLINDVLNFAKLEAGRIEYAIEPVSLAGVIASVTPLVEPQLRAKGLEFRLSPLPDAPVLADREKLRQVLINLLSNAVKFTPRGGCVWIDATEDGDGHMALRVGDTGIGIAADKQEAIFDPFVQINRNLTRTTEGTGLGLAISRDLARGMGGDLTVVSEPDAGSTFTVLLPVA